jgi:hypothetical protein
MRRCLSTRPAATRSALAAIAATTLVVAMAPTAAAFDMPPDSLLRVGGRLDYGVEVERASSPYPWNYSSRAVNDRSRLMLDLYAGRETYGKLYLKGQALWAAPRLDLGDIRFEFEQGDYYWRRERGMQNYHLRLFANERRYFIGDITTPLLDDDLVTLSRDQYGLRHDGAAGDFGWTALGAVLDERWSEARKFYYLRAGWFGNIVQASASYLHDTPAADTLQNHAVVKGEVSAAYRYLGAALSYEQSGFENSAFFIPSGDNDGQGPYPDNGSSMPDAGAVFAEVRLRKVPVKNTGLWSLVLGYRSLGDAYVNDLGTLRRGQQEGSAALYYNAKNVAIDGSLEYRRWRRTRADDMETERLSAMARGILANGMEVILRGAYAKTDDELGYRTKDDFVHAVVRRHGRKIRSGLHAMLRNVADGPMTELFGIDARFNFTATVSLYGRLIAGERVTGSDAVYWRLEVWPADYIFATFGYGRHYIGDDPFLLEDPDIGRRGESEGVWFITVRGDF